MGTENSKIIIIGSSSSAANVFHSLQKLLQKTRVHHDLVLITDRDFYSVRSLQTNYLMNVFSFEDISEEFRKVGYLNPSTSVIRTSDVKIDFENRKIILPAGKLGYKALVIAPENDACDLEYPYTGNSFLFANNMLELKQLKGHIQRKLYEATIEQNEEKKKSLMSFAVIGASEHGIGLACNISDYVEDLLKRQFPDLPRDYKRVFMLEKEKNIQINADSYLSKDVFSAINNKTISLMLSTKIKKVENDVMVLDTGRELRCSTIVCSSAYKRSSFIDNLNIPEIEKNKVQIDLFARPKGFEDVYVIGEASRHLDVVSAWIFNSHFYKQQAEHCAKNILLQINGGELLPIRFDNCMTYVSLGKRNSVFAFRNYKFTGIVGWLFHMLTAIDCLCGLQKKATAFLSMFGYLLGLRENSFIEESQIKPTKVTILKDLASKN